MSVDIARHLGAFRHAAPRVLLRQGPSPTDDATATARSSRTPGEETTCLGAAYAAGLATGVWNGLDELKSHWQRDAEWTPAMAGPVRDREYLNWRKAVDKSLGWIEEGDD